MAKIDLVDGSYRVSLSQQAALELMVVLPPNGLSEPLLALPLSLPMVWSHSPPYFCAFTKMCTDMANSTFPSTINTSHPYSNILHNPLPPALDANHYHPSAIFPYQYIPPQLPLDYKDIYLDDFMVLAQPPAYIPGMNSLYSTTCILYSKIPKIPPTGRWSPNQKLSRVMPGIALIRTS
jgi:hypothetical protein